MLTLCEEQYSTLLKMGSFKDLDITVSIDSAKAHTVLMSEEDYEIFLTRHDPSSQAKQDFEKQYNVKICPDSKSSCYLALSSYYRQQY